jgi:hypothetical protein
MHPRLFSPVAFVTLLAAGSVSSTYAVAKFEEEILVADVTSASVTVSPRGVHTAAVIPKGSRQAVVYDGVEGPRFDAIATPGFFSFHGTGGQSKQISEAAGTTRSTLSNGLSGPTVGSQILFNAQGTHFAYVGRSGTEFAVILDGKEIHRSEYQIVQFLAFSPEGEHLVAIATNKDQGSYRVIVDGQAGPWGRDISEVFFTADGKHYAYLGGQPGNQAKWMMIDGRQVKYVGDIVGFASNGLLLTRVDTGAGVTLLGNGKPMTQVGSIDHLNIEPNTGKLIMLVKPPAGTPPRDKPTMLTVDGQIVPGTEGISVTNSWFSPDGKRYAVLCKRYSPQQETFLIVDGKKELVYQNIFESPPYAPAFSPDSTKLAYLAQSPSGTFLVIDGEESDALQGATFPIWSRAGSRYAWSGMVTGQKQVFFVDGKSIPLPPRAAPNYFRFSDDGAHTVWSYGDASAQTLVVDGTPVAGVAGLSFLGGEAFDGRDAIVKFSPDGKHVAYVGRDQKNNSRQGVWVDGKLIAPSTRPQINRVTFTPDSQHVAWAVMGLKDNRGAYSVFVDGQEVLAFNNSMADITPGAWEMAADGTLTFLGADGVAFKRYRIPAPPDSSITTMLAAAK